MSDRKYPAFILIVLSSTDETFKAAAYIKDVVLDAPQDDELNTPLNRAFNTHNDLFSWYERPENRVRFRRFGMAMDVLRRLSPPGAVLQGMYFNPISCNQLTGTGFEWASLPENSLIVDVGGGIGSISLEIAQANPHLRFLVQDKEAVVPEGEEVAVNSPALVMSDGRNSIGNENHQALL